MNRKMKNTLFQLRGQLSNYQRETKDALDDFRIKSGAIRDESRQYKDEQGHYTEAIAPVKTVTRNRCKRAQSMFVEALKACADEMEQELSNHLLEVPSALFLSTLEVYKTFNLQPSLSEIKALQKMAGGSTLGLRAVNSVLESSGSKYRISFTDSAQLEKDIADLRKLTENCFYFPMDYGTEAGEVFKGQPKAEYFTAVPAGSSAYWDTIPMLNATQHTAAQAEIFETMENRWAGEVLPSVVQAVDTDLYEGDKVEVKAAYKADRAAVVNASTVANDGNGVGMEIARRIGERAQRAGEESRDIIKHYTGEDK